MESPDLLKTGYIILAVLLDGAAGLAGGFIPTEFLHKHLTTFLAFAAGTLLAVALLDLLPEAIALGGELEGHNERVFLFTLFGFLSFYVVQSTFGSHATGQSGHRHNHATGPLLLLGDALHNVTDGVAIAAGFLTSTATGVATTIAVVLHELPQEVSDYSILLAHGYSRKRAMAWLFLVQLSALIGAGLTLVAANAIQSLTPWLLAMSAGGFIYIAAADLLPDLQVSKTSSRWYVHLAALLAGIGLIFLTEHIKH